MTVESGNNEPNEFGFGGGATAPEPDRDRESSGDAAENIAVPSGDLTGAASDGLDEMTQRDDSSR
jgi:hypothetical protein